MTISVTERTLQEKYDDAERGVVFNLQNYTNEKEITIMYSGGDYDIGINVKSIPEVIAILEAFYQENKDTQ